MSHQQAPCPTLTSAETASTPARCPSLHTACLLGSPSFVLPAQLGRQCFPTVIVFPFLFPLGPQAVVLTAQGLPSSPAHCSQSQTPTRRRRPPELAGNRGTLRVMARMSLCGPLAQTHHSQPSSHARLLNLNLSLKARILNFPPGQFKF